MLNPKEFYTKIPSANKLAIKCIDFVHSEAPWIQHYYFPVKVLSLDWIVEDPFLKWLYRKFPFNWGILKLSAGTGYKWHVDMERYVGINMLLTYDAPSHCVFAENPALSIYPMVEVPYEPDHFFLLNTQKWHTVINPHVDRYLVSVELIPSRRQPNYSELLELVQEEFLNANSSVETEGRDRIKNFG